MAYPISGWGSPLAGGSQDSFYDPNSLYGAKKSFATAPIVSGPSGYFADQPQAYYTRLTAPFTNGANPAFATMVQQMYPQFLQGLRAAQATNPSLLTQNFGARFTPDFFLRQWYNRPPATRGEQNGLYGGGRMRWLLPLQR